MTLTKIAPQNLRTPGPTPIPDDIVDEMSLPMINHRGPEFKELIEATTAGLKQVFMTTNDLYILTSSGTGALEAAVVNTLSPGDKVIAATAGSFGDRFVQIAEGYGANVNRMDFEWGDAIDPEAIRAELQKDPDIKAVLVTHNETSTGVTHDLESIARVVKGEFDKLLLVDAVSSLGCIPLPVDGWNCDLVATGSQKGFMIPPGLAFISISARGWEAYQDAKIPSLLLRPDGRRALPGSRSDPMDAQRRAALWPAARAWTISWAKAWRTCTSVMPRSPPTAAPASRLWAWNSSPTTNPAPPTP